MNILFFMPTVLVGGVRTVTEILSNQFREKGYNVIWLLQYRIYNDYRDFPDGEICIYLPTKELISSENISFYHRILKEKNIDVVINQNGLYEGIKLIDNTSNNNVIIISVLHNNPVLGLKWLFRDCVTLRDDSLEEKFKRIVRIILFPRTKRIIYRSIINQFKLLYKGKSHVNVLSPRYVETIKEIAPYISDISAIANPNTYSTVNNIPKEKIVLYVGRLNNKSKRVQELLEIWAAVQRCRSSWKLIIVGEGPSEVLLRQRASNIPNIEFVGYQDPKPYYEKASILCMTSIFEGFPMTLTEAMQHGCVPMAYDSFPAVFDIITSGYDGEIIKSFNKKEYVRRLLYLMENSDYRNRLSVNATESVKRYNVEAIVNQWEDLFIKLKHQKNG